jgi:hypothetical protein
MKEVIKKPTVKRPRSLTKLEFIRLISSKGGATPQNILDAYKDPNLAYFWLMFEVSTGVSRSDPEVREGLGAIDSLGYIPNGKQAVLDNWPVEEI